MSSVDAYQREKEAKSAKRRQVAQAARDIGPTPEIDDVERRESGRFDLRKFIETYAPEVCFLGWAEFHLAAIQHLEDVVLRGARYALALPRGSGKTTLMRLATWWAISYAHRHYVYLIGANAEKATDNLDAIKNWVRAKEPWISDFPEISFPFIALDGISHRAGNQQSEGRLTSIGWGKERLVLPTVKAAPNDPINGGRDAATCGIVIGISGLTGDGIRGSLFTKSDGSQVRPDLCLLDDVQTDESAVSPSQITKRLNLINGAVSGMAGPNRELACMAAMTVIGPGDVASQLLDRTLNPEWRGETHGILTKLPTNMSQWEKYFEVLTAKMQENPPNFEAANAYYKEHQEELEEGTRATWPERFKENEVSPVQSAMHLYFRDRRTFWSEFMNQPQDETSDSLMLSPQALMEKQHGQPVGRIPIDADRLTAFIDVQKEVLFCAIMAFSPRFDGYVVGYSTFPRQLSNYFTVANLHATFTTEWPNDGLEARIYRGLTTFVPELLNLRFTREDGAELAIEKLGVDSGWMTRICERAYLDLNDPRVMLTRGVGVRSSDKPWSELPIKPGDLVGEHWRILAPRERTNLRKLEIDTNYWKTFVHARFATSMGDPGCFSLHKTHPQDHRLIADHMTAEYPVKTEGRGRKLDEWKIRPNHPDNHWFDCVIGCAALASHQGVELSETKRERRGRGARRNVAVLKRRTQ